MEKTGEVPRERVLAFEHCANFRQLGGYVTADGQHMVQHGRLYRAAALCDLTPAEQQTLHARTGVEVVLDLRYDAEVARRPDPPLPGIVVEAVPCVSRDMSAAALTSVTAGVQRDLLALDHSSEEEEKEDDDDNKEKEDDDTVARVRGALATLRAVMAQGTAAMPFGNAAVARLLAHMRAGRTLLWHCSAGKDRTGVLAMVALRVLGVPRATVAADYVLTNTCARARALAVLARHRRVVERVAGATLAAAPDRALETFRDLVGTRRENIDAAMDAIDARHGSFEQYLLAEYGVTALDIQIIRAQYLVPCEKTSEEAAAASVC